MNEVSFEREIIDIINKERGKRNLFSFSPDFLCLLKAEENGNSKEINLSSCLLENNYFENFEMEKASGLNYAQDTISERLEYLSMLDFSLSSEESILYSPRFNSIAVSLKKGLNNKKIVVYLIHRKALLSEIKSDGQSISIIGNADMTNGNIVGIKIRGGGSSHPSYIGPGAIHLNEPSCEFRIMLKEVNFENWKNYSEYSFELMYSTEWRHLRYGDHSNNENVNIKEFPVNRGPFVPFRHGNVVQVFFRVIKSNLNSKKNQPRKMNEILPRESGKTDTNSLFNSTTHNDGDSRISKTFNRSNSALLFNSNSENQPPAFFRSNSVITNSPLSYGRPLLRRSIDTPHPRSYISPLEPIREEANSTPITQYSNSHNMSFSKTPIFQNGGKENRNPLNEIHLSPIFPKKGIFNQIFNEKNDSNHSKSLFPTQTYTSSNIFQKKELQPISTNLFQNVNNCNSNENGNGNIFQNLQNQNSNNFTNQNQVTHPSNGMQIEDGMNFNACNYGNNYQIPINGVNQNQMSYTMQPILSNNFPVIMFNSKGNMQKNNNSLDDKNDQLIQNALSFNKAYKMKPEVAKDNVNVEFIHILQNMISEPFSKRNTDLDPIIFTNPTSEAAKMQLEILTKTIEYQKRDTSSFAQMFGDPKMCDVILILNDQEFRAHKTVIASASPYFAEILQNCSTHYGIERIKLTNSFSARTVQNLVKFMYFGHFTETEISELSLKEAMELFAAANYFKVSEAMKQLALESLIPRMDRILCVLILCEHQSAMNENNSHCKLVWALLYKYSLCFFSYNSKRILACPDLKEKLLTIDKDLLFKISNCSLKRIKDKDNMVEIIKLLTNSGIGNTILDLMDFVCKNFKDCRSFDKLFIENYQDILPYLRPDKGLVVEINEDDSSPNNKISISTDLRFRGEFKDTSHTNFNELMGNLRPSFNWRFSLISNEVHSEFLYISEKFCSDTRFWRAYLVLTKERKFSLYFEESGEIKDQISLFKPIICSVLIRVQVDDENCKKESFLFHAFNCSQKEFIGCSNLFELSELSSKELIHLKFTIIEYPIHSASIYYCLSEFQMLISYEKGIDKRLSASGIEKEMKKDISKQYEENIEKPKDPESKENIISTIVEMNPYDVYSVINSDYLDIDHESVVLFFVFNYLICNSDADATLLISAIRFPYLTMKNLLDVSRDHIKFRKNAYFQDKIKNEVTRRIQNKENSINEITLSNKPRLYYNKEKYRNINSADEFFGWLLESDHHEFLRTDVEALKEQIRNQQIFYENELKEKEKRYLNIKGEKEKRPRIPISLAYPEHHEDPSFQWSCSIY